jgi:hypothetical protein
MSISQGEAVFQAVVTVCGAQDGKYEPTEAQLKQIHEMVVGMFLSGVTVHSKDPDEAQLRKYVPGLTNNWLRKDKRLNGGTKYVAKNPGSRSGSGDESIKAMRTLLSITTDANAKAEIQKAIEVRQAELKPKVEVNVDALPESLRHLVKL